MTPKREKIFAYVQDVGILTLLLISVISQIAVVQTLGILSIYHHKTSADYNANLIKQNNAYL